MTKATLLDRATRAWFRAGGTDQPSTALSGLHTVAGKQLLVLANIKGTLDVFTVSQRSNLRRLSHEQWPATFSITNPGSI